MEKNVVKVNVPPFTAASNDSKESTQISNIMIRQEEIKLKENEQINSEELSKNSL